MCSYTTIFWSKIELNLLNVCCIVLKHVIVVFQIYLKCFTYVIHLLLSRVVQWIRFLTNFTNIVWTLIETLYHTTSIINVLEHHKAMYDHARMHAQSEDL